MYILAFQINRKYISCKLSKTQRQRRMSVAVYIVLKFVHLVYFNIHLFKCGVKKYLQDFPFHCANTLQTAFSAFVLQNIAFACVRQERRTYINPISVYRTGSN